MSAFVFMIYDFIFCFIYLSRASQIVRDLNDRDAGRPIKRKPGTSSNNNRTSETTSKTVSETSSKSDKPSETAKNPIDKLRSSQLQEKKAEKKFSENAPNKISATKKTDTLVSKEIVCERFDNNLFHFYIPIKERFLLMNGFP